MRAMPFSRPTTPSRSDTREARRHGRVRTREVTCSLGEVVDISASGMRVRCPKRPGCPIGQRIAVTIQSEGGEPFQVFMRPVWIRKIGFFAFELGGCFEDMDEGTRVQLLSLVRAAVTILPIHPD